MKILAHTHLHNPMCTQSNQPEHNVYSLFNLNDGGMYGLASERRNGERNILFLGVFSFLMYYFLSTNEGQHSAEPAVTANNRLLQFKLCCGTTSWQTMILQ